jgi:AraC-like DNA-binding protein
VDVARRCGVSERTLRRHLSAEGTSYAELLDETRRELATEWLTAGERTIASIATTLGFAHVSSFYKAFRRWTGCTPVEYRRGVVPRTEPPRYTEPPESAVRSDVPQSTFPEAESSAALQRS